MKSKKFKLWKDAFKRDYPADFAMLNDKYLYEIYLLGENGKK
jgi:hypothetical protein